MYETIEKKDNLCYNNKRIYFLRKVHVAMRTFLEYKKQNKKRRKNQWDFLIN